MKFLFDNNMSHPLAQALRLLSQPVTHVRDVQQLGPGATDDLILNFAATREYLVVTKDAAILRTPQFRAIIEEEGVGLFLVKQGRVRKLRAWDEAKLIVRRLDDLKHYAETTEKPFLAEIPRTGSVKRIR